MCGAVSDQNNDNEYVVKTGSHAVYKPEVAEVENGRAYMLIEVGKA